MQSRTLLLCTLLVALVPQSQAAASTQETACMNATDSYTQSVMGWRQSRVTHLRAPEGWLTLVGLEWLKPGPNTVGSAEDNALRVVKLPAHFGVLELKDGQVTLKLADGVKATLNGDAAPATTTLRDNKAGGPPDLLRCGSLSLVVIRRGEKIGIRIKDTEADQRVHFAGLDYFPIDPSWRIEATWVPFEAGKKIKVTNVLGQTEEEDAPGKAVFVRDGVTYELIPTQEAPGEELFFVLRDLTSGHETYGASRFLTAEVAKDGKVILDFNKAYNPPCAFTDFATCPLPIPENRLKLAIRAGEKVYHGPGAHAE